MRQRQRQSKFPDVFDEDVERKLWIRRKTIFLPSIPFKSLSYDLETPPNRTLLYSLERVIFDQNEAIRREVERRAWIESLRAIPGFCDECTSYDTVDSWSGITRSETPQFRMRNIEPEWSDFNWGKK